MATSVSFDVYAKDRASKTFTNVGGAAEKSEGHLSKLKSTLVKVGAGFAAFEAAKGAVELLKGSAEAAAADQAAQAHLTLALKNTTHASGEQIKTTEEWITKQSLATGVAKTDLQPALQHLAESTGSVTKAQKELHLAMNISAGTGRSLSSVTLALAKANNGSLGGLGRFGIQTSKTTMVQGKAVKTAFTLKQVTAELGKTFGGQAKAQAQSFQGQMARLGAQWEEAKVKIGDRLLPVLSKLGTWFFQTGAPAAERFGKAFQTQLVPVLDRVKSAFQAIEPTLVKVGDFMKKNPDTVKAFAVTLGVLATAIGIVTAATAAWDAVLAVNPITLVVVALAGLVAGLVYAYQHSQKFRTVVQASMHGVEAAFHVVVAVGAKLVNFFTHDIPDAFHKVTAAASNTVSWIKGHWPLIAAILTGPFGIAVYAIAKNWGAITGAAQGAVSAVKKAMGGLVSFMGSIPGRIKGALGNLGGLLLGAGKAVVQGLIDGIQSMIGSLTSKLHDITKLIPIHKGPIDKDRILLKPAGVAIMEGLISGIQSRQIALTDVLSKVTGAVQAANTKLQAAISNRNSFAAGFQSFSTSAFGADFGTDANGNPVKPTAASILAYQKQQDAQAHMVKRDVRKLVHMGLSPALIKQLQSEGAAGIPEIQALANATPAQIHRLNALNKQTSSDLHDAGMTAANRLYGQQIKADQKHADEVNGLLKEIRDLLRKEHGHTVEKLEIQGHTLVAFLKKVERTTGAKP